MKGMKKAMKAKKGNEGLKKVMKKARKAMKGNERPEEGNMEAKKGNERPEESHEGNEAVAKNPMGNLNNTFPHKKGDVFQKPWKTIYQGKRGAWHQLIGLSMNMPTDGPSYVKETWKCIKSAPTIKPQCQENVAMATK